MKVYAAGIDSIDLIVLAITHGQDTSSFDLMTCTKNDPIVEIVEIQAINESAKM